ncbi:MAG: DNA-binding response regulator [Mariprofundaceae bacterium]|nr:DNA-binding response regulator [Mariprofundaceae bacterium]
MSEDVRGLVLILTGNAIIGNQIASLLNAHGRQAQVVCSDVQAYNMILQGIVGAVVADIDDVPVSGLSVLALCKHYNPSITSYAICRDGNSKPMRLARDLSCAGYFYLKQGEIQQIDTSRGMAVRFTPPDSTDEPAHQSPAWRISHAR